MAQSGTFPYCPSPGPSLVVMATGTIKCYDSGLGVYSAAQVTSGVLLTQMEYDNLSAAVQAITPPEPFDAQFAGQMWLTGLGFILMLYGTAVGVGYALKLFKRPRNSP